MEDEPPMKRARVSLACQRCKTRKQKCDGEHPSCSNCARFAVNCEYIFPVGWKPGGKKSYITALENRVAELEGYLSGIGHSEVSDDHWESVQVLGQGQPQGTATNEEEVNSLSSAIREISLGVNGSFLGGTSTVTLGRLLDSVIKGQDGCERLNSQRDVEVSEATGIDISTADSPSSTDLAQTMGPMFTTVGTSEKLLNGYLKHIATRFPILHTPRIKELQAKRDQIDNVYDETILHLVYATSGRFLELTGESDSYFYSDQHYEAAVTNMNEIVGYGDVRSIVYLLLLGVYSLRASKSLGAWTYIGLAMRLCIENGIHRKTKSRNPTLKVEIEKRIFWSCYYLDREISVAMGRPPALSDHDIDAQLPFDIDECVDDVDDIVRASKNVSGRPCSPPSSLTSFIHQLRLKKIESEIQHLVYRVDKPFDASHPVIDQLYDRLVAWEKDCPIESRGPVKDLEATPIDSIDVYYIHYYRACRLLLYPTLTCLPINERHVSLCAQACGSLCESYKRLHLSTNIAFAPLSLQNVFLAGLTLLYCMWLMPDLSLDPWQNDQLTNCSIMLYVMTERYPPARKFRDVYEDIKTSVRKVSSKSRDQNRDQDPTRLASFNHGLMENVRNLETRFGQGIAREEFNWIIGEFTGDNSKLQEITTDGAVEYNEVRLRSKSITKRSRDDTLIFPDILLHEGGERSDVEFAFETNMHDYEEVVNDWSTLMPSGAGHASQVINDSIWTAAE